MKKREMGWNVLFYNIRRNIVFERNEVKESLSFYFFKIEIYLIPDRALLAIDLLACL